MKKTIIRTTFIFSLVSLLAAAGFLVATSADRIFYAILRIPWPIPIIYGISGIFMIVSLIWYYHKRKANKVTLVIKAILMWLAFAVVLTIGYLIISNFPAFLVLLATRFPLPFVMGYVICIIIMIFSITGAKIFCKRNASDMDDEDDIDDDDDTVAE